MHSDITKTFHLAVVVDNVFCVDRPLCREIGLQVLSSMFRLLQKHADQAKDSGYSWVVCFICVLIGFFVNGFTQTIGLLYTYLLQEFRSSRAKTGKFLPTSDL